MLVVAAYKWAANPQDASVGAGGEVSWGRAQSALSDYDPVAFEVGEELAKATGGELVGLSVGTSDVASSIAKKGVASRGPARLVLMADDAHAHLDTTRTAQLLAEGVQQMGNVDVVLTGASSIDVAAGMVPSVLAGVLGWPCVLEAVKVTAEGDKVRVDRAIEGGVESVLMPTPVVVGLAADAAKPRIPGMKDILAASKKPSEEISAALPEAKLEVVATAKPALKQRLKKVIDGTDPAAAAAELVSSLRTQGVL